MREDACGVTYTKTCKRCEKTRLRDTCFYLRGTCFDTVCRFCRSAESSARYHAAKARKAEERALARERLARERVGK